MTIRWQAQDEHLADRPISICVRPCRSGRHRPVEPEKLEWKELATSLPNDGQYIWNIPPDATYHRCHIRVEAVDQAGNTGVDQTKEPVKVDLSIPRTHVIGVEPNR